MTLTTLNLELGLDIAKLFFIMEMFYCLNIYQRLNRRKHFKIPFWYGAVSLVFIGAFNYWLMSFGWFYVASVIGGFLSSYQPLDAKDDRND